MGIFDFLKKGLSREQTVTYGGLTFKAPKPISNEEYQKLRQNEMKHWDQKYDLSTVHGIMSIPVPTKKTDSCGTGSITGQIEYYLIRKAGQYENEGKVELAIACYKKANELMPMSSVSSYPLDTYMRLPRYLRKLRRFDEARVEEQKIKALFGSATHILEENGWFERRNRELFENMRSFDTDLIEATYIGCCCAECAKYRERVYSLSGRDRRFPKIPDYLLNGTHDCGIQLYAFIDGVNSMHLRSGKEICGKKVIRYSNRPFIDDRTPEELDRIAELERQRLVDRDRELSRSDYDWLWEFMPEICPKSFSGYMRMRNAKTKRYLAIVAEAQKRGRTLK